MRWTLPIPIFESWPIQSSCDIYGVSIIKMPMKMASKLLLVLFDFHFGIILKFKTGVKFGKISDFGAFIAPWTIRFIRKYYYFQSYFTSTVKMKFFQFFEVEFDLIKLTKKCVAFFFLVKVFYFFCKVNVVPHSF